MRDGERERQTDGQTDRVRWIERVWKENKMERETEREIRETDGEMERDRLRKTLKKRERVGKIQMESETEK